MKQRGISPITDCETGQIIAQTLGAFLLALSMQVLSNFAREEKLIITKIVNRNADLTFPREV